MTLAIPRRELQLLPLRLYAPRVHAHAFPPSHALPSPAHKSRAYVRALLAGSPLRLTKRPECTRNAVRAFSLCNPAGYPSSRDLADRRASPPWSRDCGSPRDSAHGGGRSERSSRVAASRIDKAFDHPRVAQLVPGGYYGEGSVGRDGAGVEYPGERKLDPPYRNHLVNIEPQDRRGLSLNREHLTTIG